MAEKTTYFVLKEKAVPEVLLKVVAAKKLLATGKCDSVQDATESVGISRSSFYKYKDDIFPFHEDTKGKTVNMVIQKHIFVMCSLFTINANSKCSGRC